MGPAYSARRRDHGIRNPERADGSRTEQRLQPTPRGVLQGAARLNLTLGGRRTDGTRITGVGKRAEEAIATPGWRAVANHQARWRSAQAARQSGSRIRRTADLEAVRSARRSGTAMRHPTWLPPDRHSGARHAGG